MLIRRTGTIGPTATIGPVPCAVGRSVRISYAALLRIRDDDRYVLFHMRSRPGAYAPPGGVFKYFDPGGWILDRLGFQPERSVTRGGSTRSDLRGLLPAQSLGGFRRWFDSGAYREDATECLQRELAEELAEAGYPDLATDLPPIDIAPVRTMLEGPYPVTGQTYRQVRRFEIYDLVNTGGRVASLCRRLIDLAADPAVLTIIGATAADIAHGRCATALVAPPTAYLIGTHRTRPDLPPVR